MKEKQYLRGSSIYLSLFIGTVFTTSSFFSSGIDEWWAEGKAGRTQLLLIGAVTWLWEEITKTRWGREIKRRGGYDSSAQCYRHVHVEYQCEVARIFSDHESAGAMDSSLTTHTSSSQTIPTASNPQTTPTSSSSTSFQATSSSPLHVELTNGHVYTCDLVVSATGVIPNTTLLHCHVTENKVCLMMRRVRMWCFLQVQIAEDGGVVVDDEMRTALPDVYAAGDVCTTQWTHCSKLWLQVVCVCVSVCVCSCVMSRWDCGVRQGKWEHMLLKQW